MGIDGLLRLIDPVVVREHISSFEGKTVAIDIAGWIYKGCYSCTFLHNQGQKSNNFLKYIFEMLGLLDYYKITPICVFDGRYVGGKEGTVQKRKKLKQQNNEKGLAYLKEGNQEMARKYFSRCIIIDQRILATTMRALHTKNVRFLVAPYESDSQIAKLLQLGLADVAISQDSDLVIYGLKVIMKLSHEGECNYVDLSKWKAKDVESHFLKEFLNMDHVGRIETAILSGNDYNNSIKGIGFKRAIKFLTKYMTMADAIKHLREAKPYSEIVPENYETTTLWTKLIFLLATVYNPITQQLEYLRPEKKVDIVPQGMSEEDLVKIVGPDYGYNQDVYTGKIDAKTMKSRQMTVIDIANIFRIDSSKIAQKELENKQRKQLEQIQKQRVEEFKQIAENEVNRQFQNEILLEQRRKEQTIKKQERLKKMEEFKNMIDDFDGFQSEDSLPIHKKLQKGSEKIKDSDLQSQDDSISEQGSQIYLKDLNPWAKKPEGQGK